MSEPPALPMASSEALNMASGAAAEAPLSMQLVRKVLLVTAVAVLAYGAVLIATDYRAVATSLRQLPMRSIALALGIASTSYVLRFARWHRYLVMLDIRVSLVDSVLIFFSGLSMGITPGKAGELLKSVQVKQVSGAPIARTLPILAAERITDAMALFLLAALGLPGTLGAWVVVGVVVGCLVIAIVFGSRAVGTWAIDRAARFGFVARHRSRLAQAHESLMTLCAPARLLEGFALSMLIWAVHSMCLYTLAQTFDRSALDLPRAFMIDSAPALVGALAMLPGGLGVTEASMTGALVSFGHGAFTPAVAAAITLAVRVCTLWYAVGLGLLCLGIWQLKHRT